MQSGTNRLLQGHTEEFHHERFFELLVLWTFLIFYNFSVPHQRAPSSLWFKHQGTFSFLQYFILLHYLHFMIINTSTQLQFSRKYSSFYSITFISQV